MKAKLANEIEGPAIKIPEGYRVCSLKVQMDTAVSGLVNPGDRVDIFGYFRKNQDVPKTGTREILRNVRVFAVNSETEQETDPDGRQIVAKTVSVLVPYEEVATLMLATELGNLRLALRRPNETVETARSENATVESLFGQQSVNADKDPPNDQRSPSQLASAAGGFVKFLSGLKNNNPAPQVVASLPTTMQPSGPAWQMTVLTPDGGTQFTWDNEQTLPQQGSSATGNSLPASLSTPPVNGLRPAPAAAPSTGSATSANGANNTNNADADAAAPADTPAAADAQPDSPDGQNPAADSPVADD